ncbi:TPA: hypothetical protein LSH92_004508 [Citrobacter koseri]|nr:hypothetical protein [Citrobacter koseri]
MKIKAKTGNNISYFFYNGKQIFSIACDQDDCTIYAQENLKNRFGQEMEEIIGMMRASGHGYEVELKDDEASD